MKSIMIIEPESKLGISLIHFLLRHEFWITIIHKDENSLELSHPRLDIVTIDYVVFTKLKSVMEGHNVLIVCNNDQKITISYIENFMDAMNESHIKLFIVLSGDDFEMTLPLTSIFKQNKFSKLKVFNIANLKSNEVDFDFSSILTIIKNN